MATNNSPEDRIFERASHLFLRLQSADIETEAHIRAEADEWRDEDPAHDEAFRKVELAWSAVGDHAVAPEIIVARRSALARAEIAAKRRWSRGQGSGMQRYAAAAAIFLLVASGAIFYLLPMGQDTQRYETATGETRVLTLADNSRISLDAQTSIKVQYSAEARSVDLLAGQAFFDVEKDLMRPFRVRVGDRTVVALGTAFNVELIEDQVFVTLIEGRVAINDTMNSRESTVSGSNDSDARLAVAPLVRELTPGQQLMVMSDGSTELRQGVFVENATSWRWGRLTFEDEPLSTAVARVNRYSDLKIVIHDSDIGNISISGVFNTGDTKAFVEALEAYFPIRVERESISTIFLYSPT